MTPSILSRIEMQVRAGNLTAASTELIALSRKKISVGDLAHFGQLSWRSGIAEIGARVLYKTIRNVDGSLNLRSPQLVAEYALCLLRMGIVDEPRELLEKISETKLPRRLFYQAAVHISEWDHQKAVPFLKAFIRGNTVTSYERLVGKINLAACYIVLGETQKSAPLLREVTFKSSLKGYQLLLSRALELTAEMFFVDRNWKSAKEFLKSAEERHSEGSGIDKLVLQKFRICLELFESPSSKSARENFVAFRRFADSYERWEMVRDCDRVWAVANRDWDLARYVYQGSPYPAYRNQILYALKRPQSEWNRSFAWSGSPKLAPQAKSYLDIESGKLTDGKQVLAQGSVLLKLLNILCTDFYRPFRITTLFYRLNPDRFYHPETSASSVHDAIKRLRKKLSENAIPIGVKETSGFFSLRFDKPFALLIPNNTKAAPRYSEDLNSLWLEFKNKPFSFSDASKIIDRPRRTLQRLLQDAVENIRLERSGQKKSTTYRFLGK